MTADEELRQLLSELFDGSDLLRWLHAGPPLLRRVADEVPGANSERAELIHRTVLALTKHGAVDEALFQSLLHERPGRADAIRTTAARWEIALPETESPATNPGAPTRPDRRSRHSRETFPRDLVESGSGARRVFFGISVASVAIPLILLALPVAGLALDPDEAVLMIQILCPPLWVLFGVSYGAVTTAPSSPGRSTGGPGIVLGLFLGLGVLMLSCVTALLLAERIDFAYWRAAGAAIASVCGALTAFRLTVDGRGGE